MGRPTSAMTMMAGAVFGAYVIGVRGAGDLALAAVADALRIVAHRRRQPAALRVGTASVELVDLALVEIELAPIHAIESPAARRIAATSRTEA